MAIRAFQSIPDACLSEFASNIKGVSEYASNTLFKVYMSRVLCRV
jgi:hypothetical protein